MPVRSSVWMFVFAGVVLFLILLALSHFFGDVFGLSNWAKDIVGAGARPDTLGATGGHILE